MNKKKKTRTGLVVGITPDRYKINDYRLNKPLCYQQYEKGIIKGSMLLQEMDEVKLKGRKYTYFSPNNIGILLSINRKFSKEARTLFKNSFSTGHATPSLEDMGENKAMHLSNFSSIVCDYIEVIQTAIVFGYTALETFANLSISDDFKYKKWNASKRIHEIYEKESIERWINLKEKIQNILTEIYRTKKAENQKWWGHLGNLEQRRNEIIHQKSILNTEIYKCYFTESIFKTCGCPIDVIKFFYAAFEDQSQTNPIWPWLEGEKNVFPISTSFESKNFEIVGNIYEGIKPNGT